MYKKIGIIFCTCAVLFANCLFVSDVSAVITSQDLNAMQTAGDVAFNSFYTILANDSEAASEQKYANIRNNYAGSVIDESGKLRVYIAGDVASEYALLHQEMIAADVSASSVEFVNVQYSYSELKNLQNKIWAQIVALKESDESNELTEWAKKIQGTSLDFENNCLKLFVFKFDTDDHMLTQKIMGSYEYTVEMTEGLHYLVEETTWSPGQRYNIRSIYSPNIPSNNDGSTGFRCKLGSVEGFVTAGHIGTENSTVLYSSSSYAFAEEVGIVREVVHDGYADFAFVEITNSSYSMGLTTASTPSYTLHPTNYLISFPIGYTVYMCGAMSDQVRVGTIVDSDRSVGNSPGTNWLICDYTSDYGDSGGVVFALVNGDYCYVGVHDGSVNIDFDGKGDRLYAYVTKLTTMREYFSNLITYN